MRQAGGNVRPNGSSSDRPQSERSPSERPPVRVPASTAAAIGAEGGPGDPPPLHGVGFDSSHAGLLQPDRPAAAVWGRFQYRPRALAFLQQDGGPFGHRVGGMPRRPYRRRMGCFSTASASWSWVAVKASGRGDTALLGAGATDLRGRVSYRIVEVGAGLRGATGPALGCSTAAGWHVGWGRDLEEACAGTRPVVVVGNEFLDALRCTCGRQSASAQEPMWRRRRRAWCRLGGIRRTRLPPRWSCCSARSTTRRLEAFTEDGVLEVSPGLGALVRRVAGLMPSGSLVSVDYGEWFPGVVPPEEPACARGRGAGGSRSAQSTLRGYFNTSWSWIRSPGRGPGPHRRCRFGALDLHGRLRGSRPSFSPPWRRSCAGEGLSGVAGAPRRTAETASDALEADRQATVLRTRWMRGPGAPSR